MENKEHLTQKQKACFEVVEHFFGSNSQIERVQEQINSLFLELLICQEKGIAPQDANDFCEAVHHVNNFFSCLKKSFAND
ncbi:MAG: hypothetical protein MUC49_10915 [Raineya sp.]|jgi:hypothetical protein|nr:hypothetical protein [Raineya sp.]